MPAEIKRVLDRFEAAKSLRGPWEPHWQDLGDVMRPVRAEFTTEQNEGDRRNDLTFDSTPMTAVRGLASAIEGLLTPKSERWFEVKTDDEELDDNDEVKAWLEHVGDRMWRTIYSSVARFSKATAEAYLDLVTFGTAAYFIGMNRARDNLAFRALHLNSFYILQNADGVIDTIFLKDRLTARQAAQRFGEQNLGEKTKEALSLPERDQRDKKFPFIEAVFPREDRNPRGNFSTDFEFASVMIDLDSEHKIGESGYEEFPFAIMRWDTAAGEEYGRSPGMLALPDSLTLNQMGKTLLEAGHKAVDPPLWAPSDSIASAPRTFPGGITYFDADAMRETQLRSPFFPMNTGANMPLGREMQNDVREQIWSAFFKNVLNLPVDGPQMTATEVVERKQEFIRTVGPAFGRLEADGPAPTTERVFGIMFRAGAFQEPPDILRGREIKFEYQSPVEKVRRSIEALSATQALEGIAGYAQIDPTIVDHFDTDKIGREVPEGIGMPTRWLRPQAEVDQRRQQRAEAAAVNEAAEAALSTTERVADIENKAPGLIDEAAEALAE